MTVLTEQMNITLSAIEFKRPGRLYHQTNVAIEARNSSTYMPAAPIAAQWNLLGSIQESETLQ